MIQAREESYEFEPMQEYEWDRNLVWVGMFVLMAYQYSWVNKCQNYPHRKTVVVIYNL